MDPLHYLPYLSEAKCLTEPETNHVLARLAASKPQQSLCCCVTPSPLSFSVLVTGAHRCSLGAEDLKSGPHAYTHALTHSAISSAQFSFYFKSLNAN